MMLWCLEHVVIMCSTVNKHLHWSQIGGGYLVKKVGMNVQDEFSLFINYRHSQNGLIPSSAHLLNVLGFILGA